MLSKDKYDEYIEPLDEKEYKLKKALPMGLYVMDKINHKYHTNYDKKLYTILLELYGPREVKYYLEIHWANKIAYMLAAFLLLGLFGASADEFNIGFILISLILMVVASFAPDSDVKEKIKKRHMMIQLDFPDFLNKLTLLINAGMTILKAWGKVVTDNESEKPLYQELEMVWYDIKAGKSEAQAYEDFAKRCKTPEITKFISVIIQNLRKGNAELASILRLQANDCWEMRKNVAKRLGEEAGSKLILPVMLMFIAIIMIVMTPAVLQFQNM